MHFEYRRLTHTEGKIVAKQEQERHDRNAIDWRFPDFVVGEFHNNILTAYIPASPSVSNSTLNILLSNPQFRHAENAINDEDVRGGALVEQAIQEFESCVVDYQMIDKRFMMTLSSKRSNTSHKMEYKPATEHDLHNVSVEAIVVISHLNEFDIDKGISSKLEEVGKEFQEGFSVTEICDGMTTGWLIAKQQNNVLVIDQWHLSPVIENQDFRRILLLDALVNHKGSEYEIVGSGLSPSEAEINGFTSSVKFNQNHRWRH